ncbi:Hypothetical protein A7982_05662 [Minicystis rosea]|nr:Hypothetical protein A7982_05662 [Minicystis rosea]
MGCAQERAPINRVQADALAKSFFVGTDLKDPIDDPEFYMRGTIVDVGYGAAQDGLFTSTYAQPISRIKWEVTEDLLNARLSYERIADSDGKGNTLDGLRKKTTNDGQIVASYRIKSHFDIRRSYNPTTGEEQNVVEENSSDRPWYQREYFRVDWAQNLATDSYDFDTLTSLGWIGGIQYAPLAYTVLDPASEDAPHFDADAGYFDVTNKAFAKPAVIDISALGWGLDTIPACMLPGDFAGGTQPYGNCNPIEITIRQSFRKVVDKDYEPVDFDGYRFQAFGIFTTERVGYDRDYGMTDSAWHKFADRYNIWERSHFYKTPESMEGAAPCATFETTELPTGDPNADPNRDLDKDGTADECAAAGSGSRCDVFTKKCTLPYRQRKAVTIPWYINGGNTTTINSLNEQIANAKTEAETAKLKQELAEQIQKGEDLFEATNWAVMEWDLALKTSIQTSRMVECKKTGGQTCQTDFPMWVGQQEDIDEAVAMSRELDACRRKAALGATDPATTQDSEKLEAARKAGWTSETCAQAVKTAADALASERQNPADPSAAAMKTIVPWDPVIVLCHNPVIQGDHPACGALGLSPRLGDIRYNTVLNIDKPQSPSAWGIMVDADDPLTGEKVAASINIWTHITDIASQGLVDLIRYMNGELKTADITEGTYITNWAKAAQLGNGASGATISKAQIDQRIAAATNLSGKQLQDIKKNGISPAIAQQIRQFHNEKVMDTAISNEVASPAAYAASARMRQARGTPMEAKLINRPMLERAGLDTSALPAGAALDQASPLALNNPRIAHQLSQMREAAMAARGACIINEAPEASSLTAIADAMKRKFPTGASESPSDRNNRYKAMLSYLRRKYHYAVIGHEMGHSIGLRHNFVSTYAALHFRPQYWQLRTQNGTLANKPCQDADPNGEGCVGPRYWDPLTSEEQDQAIWMFQHSTVMDYPGDVSQDMVGLGTYDFAAARMFYGDVVSVYDVKTSNGSALDTAYLAGGKVGVGLVNTMDNFGGLVGIQYSVKGGTLEDDDPNAAGCAAGQPCTMHYSQLQRYYKLISNCVEVTPTQPSWWRESVDGKWDPLFDGGIVSVKGKPTKCRTLPVDYLGWDQMRAPSNSETGGGFFRGSAAVDPATKRIRVPYSFATDHWADSGNTSVFRHDNGADPYEQVMFLTTTQENRHILDNYRRGRNTFNVRAAADRSYSRYNEKLLGIAGGMGFLGSIYKDFATNQGYTYNTLWPYIIDIGGYRDNIIGGTVAFDHFTRELSRPEAGEHYFNPTITTDLVLRSANDPEGNAGTTALVVPNGSTGYLRDIGFGGHLLENGLSENHGDYDSEYTINAGSYYDKINVAILLSESEDRFISQSRQDFYDARFRAVGMADIYPEGFRRVIANALTDDRSILASHVTATGIKKPEVTGAVDPQDPTNNDTKLYPKNPIGWTSWWPNEGPMECFPSNGSNVCASYTESWNGNPGGFNPINPATKVAIDPQIGFEVQKFLIAWTAAYIPANQKAEWVDMMRIYRLGQNADPSFESRIEWQDPASGQVYYAKTYGKECLFGAVKVDPADPTSEIDTDAGKAKECKKSGGKWVQRGIAARVLEYANELTSGGYLLDTTKYPQVADSSLPAGFNKYGRAMFVVQPDGTPVIAGDPTMKTINVDGTLGPAPVTCDNNVDPACTPLNVWDNHFSVHLAKYKEVPDFLWEVIIKYGIGTPDQLGVYPN